MWSQTPKEVWNNLPGKLKRAVPDEGIFAHVSIVRREGKYETHWGKVGGYRFTHYYFTHQ
jgi:hypothetical protein